ncbi:class I SAM-dependent methyltransferase [Streptomyces sp. S.PB5]|uniref:class I SAM-dependent methyltransferase n=1 Tax=Streptomyces sp. S.PB5 TaxID=3020844 RepID=UPI0025B0D88D|nr:class I SAM-dependent methyltransferase [Streptomyces sp. S.PB5]MDN3023016.1 class I SAM-dependent methyltransferase [Streptomyces sp. S.PB5]
MSGVTEAFDAAERAMWAGRAEAYAASFGRLCAGPVGALLDAAGVPDGGSEGPAGDSAESSARPYVLDVGTGTGTAALAALERGARVCAVDADAGMVAAARARGVAAEVAVLPELPCPDGEFDVVLGNFTLNHVGRPRAALAELRRVLRPGGRIALTLWGARRGAGQGLLGRACGAGGAVRPRDLPRMDPAEDFVRTPEGVAGLLHEAGFKSAECTELAWDHRTTVEEWWGGVAAGLTTVGLVMAAQDARTVVRIRREYERLSARFAVGGGELALPHCALLAHGVA